MPIATRVCLVGLTLVLAFAAGAGAQPPYTSPYGPGFKATVGKAYIECHVSKKKLECLNYSGKLPAGAQCSFGGTVPTVTLDRTRIKTGFTCVDEGYHDWHNLGIGRHFKAKHFTCVHRKRSLRCRRAGRRFAIDRRGRLLRGGSGQTSAASDYRRCAGVVLSNGSADAHTSTEAVFVDGVTCHKGRRVARRYMKAHERGGRRSRPFGFKCSGGDDGVACERDGRRVTWGYYYD